MSEANQYKAEDELAAEYFRGMVSGDGEALEALYNLHKGPLYQFLLGFLGNREAAEEVLQDLFVKAYRGADRYDENLGSAFSYLATMGRRLALDRLRKRGRRVKLVQVGGEQGEGMADQSKDAAESVYQRAEMGWMRGYFEELPRRERTVLERSFFGGYSQREIAEELGLPLGTVKSDIKRGLERLRQHLALR